MKKLILILVPILLLGCQSQEDQAQKDYNQCISFCASSLATEPVVPATDFDNDQQDFVTIELCRKECEEKFLS
ncbi:MAG: hypothetical protein QGH47_02660 [Candidatus Woesearchaeota archaeon]|nr:hypothetical protein [Candidatus Woesearchaeota archaeon]